jgi:hypothetical protein
MHQKAPAPPATDRASPRDAGQDPMHLTPGGAAYHGSGRPAPRRTKPHAPERDAPDHADPHDRRQNPMHQKAPAPPTADRASPRNTGQDPMHLTPGGATYHESSHPAPRRTKPHAPERDASEQADPHDRRQNPMHQKGPARPTTDRAGPRDGTQDPMHQSASALPARAKVDPQRRRARPHRRQDKRRTYGKSGPLRLREGVVGGHRPTPPPQPLPQGEGEYPSPSPHPAYPTAHGARPHAPESSTRRRNAPWLTRRRPRASPPRAAPAPGRFLPRAPSAAERSASRLRKLRRARCSR